MFTCFNAFKIDVFSNLLPKVVCYLLFLLLLINEKLVDLISERRKLKKHYRMDFFFFLIVLKDSMEKPFPFDIDEMDNEPFETSTSPRYEVIASIELAVATG